MCTYMLSASVLFFYFCHWEISYSDFSNKFVECVFSLWLYITDCRLMVIFGGNRWYNVWHYLIGSTKTIWPFFNAMTFSQAALKRAQRSRFCSDATDVILLFAAHTAVISHRHVLWWRVTTMTSYMTVTASGTAPAEKLIMVKELCRITDGEGEKVRSKPC